MSLRQKVKGQRQWVRDQGQRVIGKKEQVRDSRSTG